MIAFQHIKSGEFLSTSDGFNTMPLLADAYPWHESDEVHLRFSNPFLEDYRTVTFSTRIDHPSKNLAVLTREQLAARYPITQ